MGAAIALALAMILAAGCGTGRSAFPTGKWTATNAAGSVAIMEYRPDGTWVISGDGSPIAAGKYSTDGTTITFLSDSYCQANQGAQGTYRWTHEEDKLTLKKQTDPCTDRIGVLDGTAWTPVKWGPTT
jgi:hypothetical protein